MDFIGFPKITRLKRNCVVTEKIDGTNASIYISEDSSPIVCESGRTVPFLVGSRTRWIFPENDNMGFARWAYEHVDELLKLGPGQHFGEWMGQGIQRNYGLKEKRFYLFNTGRWIDRKEIVTTKEEDLGKRVFCPSCCYVVPVLYTGIFDNTMIEIHLQSLKTLGSKTVPGFMKPEGVVIYHAASRMYFKQTIENDEKSKGSKEE